jgi:anthranilate phosphoribosyltransferase
MEAVRGGNIEDNLRLARSVLDGEQTPARDAILMNAGASLYVAGLADSLEAGASRAAELIDSGQVAAQVARIQQVSAALQAEQAELAAP